MSQGVFGGRVEWSFAAGVYHRQERVYVDEARTTTTCQSGYVIPCTSPPTSSPASTALSRNTGTRSTCFISLQTLTVEEMRFYVHYLKK